MLSFARAFTGRRRMAGAAALAGCGVALAVVLNGSASAAPPPGPAIKDKTALPSTRQLAGRSIAYSDLVGISPGGVAGATARCPAGTFIMGGGGNNDSYTGDLVLNDSRPYDGTSWNVYYRNLSQSPGYKIRAWAVCGP